MGIGSGMGMMEQLGGGMLGSESQASSFELLLQYSPVLGSSCEYELLTSILTQQTSLTLKWNIDTDVLLVLHAMADPVQKQLSNPAALLWQWEQSWHTVTIIIITG